MERTAIIFVILSFNTLGSDAYQCPDEKYIVKAQQWWEIIEPYCGNFTENNSQRAIDCIQDEIPKYMKSVNSCQEETKKAVTPSYYQYMQWACNNTAQGNELFACCMADTLINSGATKEAGSRASLYSDCLKNNVKPMP